MVDVRTNLLKNHRTLSEKEYQKEREYLRYSVVALVIVTTIVIALSAWNLFLTSKMKGIEEDMTKASQEMQGLVQASAQQIYLISRLKYVTGFLADRSVNREAMQKILSTTIPGTHVSGVTFEDDRNIDVQYIASDTLALESLLDYYTADTEFFTQAVSRGVSRPKDGTYQITMGLQIPKGDK